MDVTATREDLLQQLRQIKQTVKEEFETLSENQIQWKPAPEKWGVLECLIHLNIANQYYVNQLKFKVEHAPTNILPSFNFEMSFNGRLMLGILDPKSTRKIPSPGMFKPKPYHLDTQKGLIRFYEIIGDLEQVLEASDTLDWNTKIVSPFTALIKFRLGDVLLFVTAHYQRHLNQARRVILQPDFPIS
ncbi:DinB family protein [Runella sp.]|uniref:DinB family protein n=1 Tax=Runella sp. TaxID=1960881 RepID=UPI003D117F22